MFRSDSKDLPDLMFKKGYDLIAQKGGVLFSEKEYNNLRGCMRTAGDKYFVIENEYARDAEGDFPYLQFKFPINTTWAELNNGDEYLADISHETLFIMNKHFFVFGDSGKWGKYAACNYRDTPSILLVLSQKFYIFLKSILNNRPKKRANKGMATRKVQRSDRLDK